MKIPATRWMLPVLLLLLPAPAAAPAVEESPPPPPAVTGVLADGGTVRVGVREVEVRPGSAFRLEGIPPGSRFDLEITPDVHRIRPVPPFRDLRMPLEGDADVGVLGHRLRPVTFLVTDPAGAPLHGAVVALHVGRPPFTAWSGEETEVPPPRPTAEAHTDDGGRAVLEDVLEGPWIAVVAAEGRATAMVPVHVPPEGPPQEVRVLLPASHAVRGTVRGPDGAPLAGARVRAAPPFSAPPFLVPNAVADAGGRFVLEGLPAGVARLSVRTAAGLEASAGTWILPAASEVDLVAGGTGTVRGVVRDADDGRPLEGVEVRVHAQGGEREEWATAAVVTGKDGTFAAAGLPEGSHAFLRAAKRGYACLQEEPGGPPYRSLVTAGTRPPRVLLLRRAGASIRGRVTGPGGKPVAGAAVTASVEGVLDPWPPRTIARTDDEGGFLLRGLPGGVALVRVDAEGFVQPGAEGPRDLPLADRGREPPRDRVAVPAAGEARLDVELEPTGAIAGVVVDPAGRPVPRVAVGGTFADDRGWFVVRGLHPGRPAWIRVEDRTWWGEAGPFQVAPGETLPEVRVPVAPAGSVGGVVRGPDGAPVPGARVTVVGGPDPGVPGIDAGWPAPVLRRHEASTDAGGRFLLEGIAPARLAWRPRDGGEDARDLRVPSSHLVVRAPGFPPAAFPVPEPGEGSPGTAAMEIVLAAGRTLEGVVTGPGGAPVAGVRVSVRGREAGRIHGPPVRLSLPVAALSGADGRFTLRDLPPGPWDLLLRAPGFRTRALAAAEGPPVAVVLDRAVVLEGVVTEAATGRPLAGCLVTARLLATVEEDLGAPAAATGPDGAFAIPGLGPVGYEIRVEPPEGSDLRPFRGEATPSPGRGLPVALEAGLPLAGRVLDGEGLPVGGAVLELRFGDPKRRRDVPGVVRSAPDGTFRFRGLEEGSYSVSLRSAGRGEGSPFDSGDADGGSLLSEGLEGIRAGTTDAVLRVRRCRPVTGRILGVDGAPASLGGSLLLVTDEGERGIRKIRVPLLLDGSFRTPPLDPARRWELWASGFEGTAGAVLREVLPGARDVAVALEAGAPLAGRALDQDGRPLPAGTRILAEADGVDPEFPARVGRAFVAGEEGSFEIPHLRRTPYRVAVEKSGDAEPVPTTEKSIPGVEVPTLRAVRFFAASGRVVDAAGRPVPLERAMARAPGAPAYAAHGTGSADGTFRVDRIPFRTAEIAVVTRGRSVLLGTYGLPASGLVVPLSADPAPEPPPEAKERPSPPPTPPPTRPERRPTPPPRAAEGDPAGTRVLDGTKIRPGPVEGRVLAAGGGGGVARGVVELTVHRLDDATGKPSAEPAARVPVDGTGRFRTPDLEAARYELRARGPGWKPGSVKVLSDSKDHVLALEPGLSVAGIAVDAATGAPVAGIPVRMVSKGPAFFTAESRTGEDGSFEVGFAPPGECDLLFGLGRDRQPWMEIPGDWLGRRVERIALGTSGLRVELPRGLALGGTLRDGRGNALPPEDLERLRVSFHAGGPDAGYLPHLPSATKRPGPGGEFRFGSLPPGRYSIRVAWEDTATGTGLHFEPTVHDAGATDLLIPVPLAPPISGRVLLPEGTSRPPDFHVEVCTVSVHTPATFASRDPAVPSHMSVRYPVELDGTFRTGRLDGSKVHDLFATVPGLLPGEARGVEAGTADVLLAPAPGAILDGIVTDETGAPVPGGVPVTAVGTGGTVAETWRSTAGAATGPGGRFRITGLVPGMAYLLRAGGMGTDFLPPAQAAAVAPGPELVVIRVRRGAAASGVLADASGAPLPFTRVQAEPLEPGDLPPGYSWWSATDPSGAFRIAGLPPGKFRLLVHRPGKATAEFGPFEAPGRELLVEMAD